MYRSFSSFTILFVGILTLQGCMHLYVPIQESIPPGAVPEISCSESVALVNGQDCDDEVIIRNFGMWAGTWKGKFNEWTDVALGVLQSELEKKKIDVKESGVKKFTLAITHAEMTSGSSAMAFRCNLNLEVKTGDGYSKTFKVHDESTAFAGSTRLKESVNGAVMQSVVAMLNDEHILNYLKE